MALPKTPWKVTDQSTDQTRNDNNGNTHVGSLIYFTTGQGNNGVVFIPNNLLTMKHIRQTVADAASQLDAIGNLSEGTFPE